MLGMIESLNLGTSSGIVLYEITKQRREYQRMYKYKNRRGRKFIAEPDQAVEVLLRFRFESFQRFAS